MDSLCHPKNELEGMFNFDSCVEASAYMIICWVWGPGLNIRPDSASQADLHTFMANSEIFNLKDGHVTALEGL
jgi:galactonate dehydratase